MGFKHALVLCAIGVFSLTGCGKTETTQPAKSQSEYPQLLGVVKQTEAAVEAKDFAKAQQEFDQFEGVWSPVEDGIKAKSSESYDAIEEDMDHVTAALKSSQSEQALTALQSLNTHIQSIPAS